MYYQKNHGFIKEGNPSSWERIICEIDVNDIENLENLARFVSIDDSDEKCKNLIVVNDGE